MKKISIIAIIITLALSAHAQRFEWAKGYTIADGNDLLSIVGGITDSVGDLYILGNIDPSSKWNGQYLIPSINKTTKGNVDMQNVLIAKISSEGDMIWKKVIFSNNNKPNSPYEIRKLGDSAFACLIGFTAPSYSNYTYYLDTFLFGETNYPIDYSYMAAGGNYTMYLVFDFDGHLIEQHSLCITYTDSVGDDIVTYVRPQVDSTPYLLGTKYMYPSFDVDKEGNIFICRRGGSDDYVDFYGNHGSVVDGSIRGLKFWVDKRLAGEYRIENSPEFWYPQVMKFSPHFDTLLACKYVVQRNDDSIGLSLIFTNIKVDTMGNYYFMCYMNGYNNHSGQVVIDSVRGISFSHTDRNNYDAFLVKYDARNNNAMWVIALEDYAYYNNSSLRKYFFDLDFDYDSNLIFISGTLVHYRNSDAAIGDFVAYNGMPLSIKSNAFFMSFYNDDCMPPTMHSYGSVPGVTYSNAILQDLHGNLYCKNNRVFLQSVYKGGVISPTQTIRYTNWNDDGIGLTVFDYSGRIIDGIDYNSIHPRNKPGTIVAHDSVLYLCNFLAANASFGDINFPVSGRANVIAKYVDTAFMHPYVRPAHGIETVSAVAPRVYPVPASERLYFDSPDGGVPTAVTAISLSGWRMPLPATATSADISCLAPGVYLLEITTPKGVYYTKFVKR